MCWYFVDGLLQNFYRRKSCQSCHRVFTNHNFSASESFPMFVSKVIFSNSSSLSTLNIFLSRIQDIPPTAFQDLHSLEWIKLYNNLLTTLHYELMEPVLDSLQHIDIHSKCFWFIICIIDDKKFNEKTIWLRLIEYERQLWEIWQLYKWWWFCSKNGSLL